MYVCVTIGVAVRKMNIIIISEKRFRGEVKVLQGGRGVKQAKVIYFCGGAGRPRVKVGAAHRD